MFSFLVLGVWTFVVFAVCAALYILLGISHMKALKMLGYDKAWLAWVPYGVWFACSDAVSKDEENVRMFDSFDVPAMVFKLWWIVPLAFIIIPVNANISSVVNFGLNIVFLGCTYAKMYAILDNKEERDTQVLGCVSGFLPIIAVVKFLSMKNENVF